MILKRWIDTILRVKERHSSNGCTIDVSKDSKCHISELSNIVNSMIILKNNAYVEINDGVCIDSSIIIVESSVLIIDKDVNIKKSDFNIYNLSNIKIGFNSVFFKYNLRVQKGAINIGDNNIFKIGRRSVDCQMMVEEGTVIISNHNIVNCEIWVRFNGTLKIECYNNFNECSEIRCDEKITIGSYNLVSYYCDIWDTNTHFKYQKEEKNKLFETKFPSIGKEINKPSTLPVVIGNYNWLGKYSCILKGCYIGNDVIVGTRAVVSNCKLEDGKRVVMPKSMII